MADVAVKSGFNWGGLSTTISTIAASVAGVWGAIKSGNSGGGVQSSPNPNGGINYAPIPSGNILPNFDSADSSQLLILGAAGVAIFAALLMLFKGK